MLHQWFYKCTFKKCWKWGKEKKIGWRGIEFSFEKLRSEAPLWVIEAFRSQLTLPSDKIKEKNTDKIKKKNLKTDFTAIHSS